MCFVSKLEPLIKNIKLKEKRYKSQKRDQVKIPVQQHEPLQEIRKTGRLKLNTKIGIENGNSAFYKKRSTLLKNSE